MLGTAASLLMAPAAARADRPTRVPPTTLRGTTHCDNAGVKLPAVAGRVAQPADFIAAGACNLSPDSVEGPFFICANTASARDIGGGVPGQPLTVALRVVDRTCAPVPGAIVDVWSCDARGNYSGFDVNPDNGSGMARWREGPVLPERFQRGVLATDADGIAEFDMVYPGHYFARAIHTHFKVHVGNTQYLTSQALYPEEINEKVMALAPYSEPRPTPRTLNARDLGVVGETGLFTVKTERRTPLALLDLVVKT